MLDGGARDARRTERFLDGIMEAEERGAAAAPADLDLDPGVLLAAHELRADLVRVHPSFRFEEGLASRLAQTGGRMQRTRDDLEPALGAASIAPFRVRRAAAAEQDSDVPHPQAAPGSGVAPALRRLPLSGRPSRPFVFGGVGVASAAISIGAVYVAWRWSRASQSPMVRAVRAGRAGRAYASGHGRRAGVLHGILGVMS